MPTGGLIFGRDHAGFVAAALREAAAEEDVAPVGAVVVKDGHVIGRGHNRREALNDPTALADVGCRESPSSLTSL